MADTILKAEDIENTKQAINTYKTTCSTLYTQLETEIINLTSAGAGFNGDSAVGYNEFFTNIKKALKENLIDEETSLMAGLSKILDSIKESLLDDVDPSLGKANRDAGNNSDANAANGNVTNG